MNLEFGKKYIVQSTDGKLGKAIAVYGHDENGVPAFHVETEHGSVWLSADAAIVLGSLAPEVMVCKGEKEPLDAATRLKNWLYISSGPISRMRNMYVIASGVMVLFASVFSTTMHMKEALWGGLLVAAYLLTQALVTTYSKDRYAVVRAVVTGTDDGYNAVRQKQRTFRFAPVDENNELIAGAQEICVTYSGRRSLRAHSFVMNAAYILVFSSKDDVTFDENNLVKTERC